MAHTNTVLAQLLQLIPRHEFQPLAKQHHQGQKLRKISRWDQFVALMMAQLTGRQSLRDIEANINVQTGCRYHLGVRRIAKSSLARVNEKQPYTLYEALFGKLVSRCQHLSPQHKFRFKNPLFSLDASLIELSLAIFPWADHNRSKAAMKLHVGLDHRGHFPAFATVTDGARHDVPVGREFDFPKGSVVVIDKGYTDYAWYKQLTEKGIFFVTRQRTNAKYRVIERREVNREQGITSDQVIELTGVQLKNKSMPKLRRIGYRDAETGKHYVFLTNHFELSATTVANVYKDRWQVELFFKALKQNLKIHAFVGNSRNAVLTQIWIALCTYLLLSYLKFLSKTGWSEQRILRLLQANLFSKKDLMTLIRPFPPEQPGSPPQLALWA
ncbi:IS4 family transposase [Parahaliea mediterranea]|uniref:IS4 family transposase n=1 Tax=Parahaliea mediterranea TaxID=651086 RepID=A0A939DKK4_9GAMM|nr:IS4 family transposase [Parahaliea mediterranea]MBN7799207.1 IS4 family transposase [Parahaliea mediterranea]